LTTEYRERIEPAFSEPHGMLGKLSASPVVDFGIVSLLRRLL